MNWNETMSRTKFLFSLVLMLCLVGSIAVWVIGSLDKSGQFRIVIDPVLIMLVAPFAVIAALAIWNRHRTTPLGFCLLTVAVIAPWAGVILWQDHIEWRRELPGRETMHMGTFVALVIEGIGCGIAIVAVLGHRLLANRDRGQG